MAKKKQPPKPDKHGYVSTGIYRTKVAPDKEPKTLTHEQSKKAITECLSYYHDSAQTTIQQVRSKVRDWMLPHLDGPISGECDGELWVIDFGDGKTVYRVKDPIGSDGGTTIQRQLRDMFNALTELVIIEGLIDEPSKVGLLMRSAMEFGRLEERWQIRPFEKTVRGKRASISALDQANEKRKAAAAARFNQTEQAIKVAESQYPERKDNTDFIYGKAAERLGVAKSTVYRRMNQG